MLVYSTKLFEVQSQQPQCSCYMCWEVPRILKRLRRVYMFTSLVPRPKKRAWYSLSAHALTYPYIYRKTTCTIDREIFVYNLTVDWEIFVDDLSEQKLNT